MQWKNYINQNTKRDGKSFRDCQLVSVLNAYRHYSQDLSITPDSDEYFDLLKECGCLYGECINVKEAMDKFNLEEDKIFVNAFELRENLKPGHFIEANVRHKYYHKHVISIVDYCKTCDAVRVTNFKYATSTDGWIFFEDLEPLLGFSGILYVGRTYKIKEHDESPPF